MTGRRCGGVTWVNTVPPLAEREKPALSVTLPFPRRLDMCQSCGAPGNPSAGFEGIGPLGGTLGVDLEKWQEADPWDSFGSLADKPTIVMLCPACSKRLIDSHARLYRKLDQWQPIPGVMTLCHGCTRQADLQCTHPWLKANGGQGLHVKFPKPTAAHLNYGGGRGEFKYMFHGPPSHCAGRILAGEAPAEASEA